MLAPVAVALALSFWGAQHPEAPAPCALGVTVEWYSSATEDGYATFGAGCTISLDPADVDRYPLPVQCGLVAHELGHSLYSLLDTDHGIMDVYTARRPIPGICYPPQEVHREDSQAARAAANAARSRPRSRRTQPGPDAAPRGHQRARRRAAHDQRAGAGDRASPARRLRVGRA